LPKTYLRYVSGCQDICFTLYQGRGEEILAPSF
jgi:hypothetical protein